MRTILAIFACTFFLNTASMDNLPSEVKQKIVTSAFKNEPGIACCLLHISREFFEISLPIITDKNIIFDLMRARDKTQVSRQIFAMNMRTRWSLDYLRANDALWKEEKKEVYFKALQTNPYADVNYTRCADRLTAFFPKLYWALRKEKFDWVEPLLTHGADPDEYYEDDCDSPSHHAFTMIVIPKNAVEKTNGLKIMDLFFKHGASVYGPKNDDPFVDAAILYESPEALKLLAKYGYIMPNNQDTLYSYLSDTKINFDNPSLEIVEFLVKHGCDPYKITKTDAGILASPFTIATEFDPVTSSNLLHIFDKYKKSDSV